MENNKIIQSNDRNAKLTDMYNNNEFKDEDEEWSEEGTLYLHTNLRTLNDKKEFVDIGEVIEIRKDDKEVEEAGSGSEVSIKIKTNNNVTYGRHFDNKNLLFSKMTNNTVKMLKIVKSEYKIDIDLLNELLAKNNIMT
jgi:hypothetical protein